MSWLSRLFRRSSSPPPRVILVPPKYPDYAEVAGNALRERAGKLGLEVQSYLSPEYGIPWNWYDIIDQQAEKPRRVLAMIIDARDLSIGVLTQEAWSSVRGRVNEIPREYQFEPSTFESWLDGWFDREIQKALATT